MNVFLYVSKTNKFTIFSSIEFLVYVFTFVNIEIVLFVDVETVKTHTIFNSLLEFVLTEELQISRVHRPVLITS